MHKKTRNDNKSLYLDAAVSAYDDVYKDGNLGMSDQALNSISYTSSITDYKYFVKYDNIDNRRHLFFKYIDEVIVAMVQHNMLCRMSFEIVGLLYWAIREAVKN